MSEKKQQLSKEELSDGLLALAMWHNNLAMLRSFKAQGLIAKGMIMVAQDQADAAISILEEAFKLLETASDEVGESFDTIESLIIRKRDAD